VFASDEAEVGLTLDAQVFEDDLELVVFADDVVLLAVLLLFLAVLLVLVAGREREARVALEEVPDFVELLLELGLTLIVLDVLQQLVYYAPETPQI
jgi:hypothetical protein